MRFLGLEWAPLNIPFERRLQTLAVLHFLTVFVIAPIFCVTIPIYLIIYTSYWWIVALYCLWFWYDYDTPSTGSRSSKFFRHLSIWRHFANYFPITLEKTVDLDPTKNYIFGSHPHGIFSCAAFANFGADATGFSQLFPGITVHLVTLVGQFWFPLRREYALLSGAIESSKPSLEYVLDHSRDGGRAIVVVVGGGREVMYAKPGCYDLIVGKRKGFVKLAIRHGASLVPVYNFGENETFMQYDTAGTILRSYQEWMKQYCGFSPPFFHGRGIFNYTLGLMPYRKPIHTIVGKPIQTTKTENPSREQIDEMHKRYLGGLTELFENNKERFGIHEGDHLNFV